MAERAQLVELVLREHLPFLDAASSLEAESNLIELGLDSMGTMDLLAALEDRFEIVFPEEALTLATFATPASVWSVVSSLLPDAGPDQFLAAEEHAAR